MLHEGIQQLQGTQLHQAFVEIAHSYHLAVGLLGDLLGMLARIVLQENGHNGRARMIDHLTEQAALHHRRQGEQVGYGRTAHLAGHRDAARITAKILNEVLHELQGQEDVEHAGIAWYLVGFGREEAERPQSVLWRHQHYILFQQIVGWRLRVAALVEVLAVYVDQHRQAGRHVRRGYGHGQAVLHVQHIVQLLQGVHRNDRRTANFLSCRIHNIFPGLNGTWRLEEAQQLDSDD